MVKEVKVQHVDRKPAKTPVVKQQPGVKEEAIDSEPHPESTHNQQAKQKVPSNKAHKHNRIIIRNLVVDINDKHLKKLCSKFGEILEINIPRHPVKNYSRGFAFIEFATKNMCLKAIKELNGTQFKGRTIVVDLSVAKKAYEMNAKANQQAGQEQDGAKMEVEADNEAKMQVEQETPVAKKNNNKGQVKKEQSEHTVVEKTEKDREEELQRTIFVRNLPLDVSEQQLFNFFRQYGKLKFAKVVMDKETMESKGTGFVLFREPGIAQKLIEYSKEYEKAQTQRAGNINHAFKEDPTIQLQLKGKILKIFPAQERKALANKIEQRDGNPNVKKQEKQINMKKIRTIEELIETDRQNKRNLQMALEGMFTPQKWMRKADQDKLQEHGKEKLEKLKNPNNYVSETRIMLKNLPKTMTEQEIKTICFTYLNQEHNDKKRLMNYCKLMLDKERVKSIGTAFVEFTKKQVSSGFLKWLEENRTQLFQPKQAVIAEFTIQDARKKVLIQKKIRKVKHKSKKPKQQES